MVMMDMQVVMEAAATTEDCKSAATSFEFQRRNGGGGRGGGGYAYGGHFSSSCSSSRNTFISAAAATAASPFQSVMSSTSASSFRSPEPPPYPFSSGSIRTPPHHMNGAPPFPSSSSSTTTTTTSSSFKWEDAQKWLPLPDSPSPSLPDYSNHTAKPAIPITPPLLQFCSVVHPSKQQQQAQARMLPPISRSSPGMDAETVEDEHADVPAGAINYNNHCSSSSNNSFYRSSMSSFQTGRHHVSSSSSSAAAAATCSFAFPSPSPSPTPAAAAASTISDAFYFFPSNLVHDTTKDVLTTLSTTKPFAAAHETDDDVHHPSLIILQNPKPLLDSSDWSRHPDSGHLELHYRAHPFPATSIYSDVGAMARCKGLRSVSSTNMRDMGTEMTPMASQEPSQTPTPIPATTPTIHSPTSGTSSTSSPEREFEEPSSPSELRNTHATEGSDAPPPPDQAQIKEELVMVRLKYQDRAVAEDFCPTTEPADFGKLRLEGGPDRTVVRLAGDSKALKGVDLEEVKKNVLETKAVAWEEVQQAKSMARFKRELARIQAWENHQKAKAEAEMKRIEVKMERKRVRAQEKLVKKLAAMKKRAEERRAVAEGRREEEAVVAAESAQRMRRTGRLPPAWLRCFASSS